ncbi:capsule biosynthesis protein CapA [Paenibacillus sp. FSL R7-0273]|uniref:CapA family protein n=1 Tax=Paenibacillus sp. FSL R7-0273 TaxID=1536772 RepID=UPI0004F65264|nr:CapA family protein [Paenibacillus sp. FSL R7-0273]AIQ45426.1 capsule biosynthesis protein CapA [Paenibacillus sp. FSL R7-0273]OMF89945.1 capsule biosynthesis protein CapA [Paenibacillus sp. FSL R7-0273]
MKFLVSGDALFSSSNLYKTMDPELLALLQGADEAFTNAEFVTPRRNTAPAAGRGYQTSVRPKALDEFKHLNIRYVSFANNHTGDYGVEGMVDTIEEAEARGLFPLGVGMSLHEARKPVFIDTPDGRIAIITIDVTRSEVFAASNPGNGVPARPGVNPLRWSRTYVVNDQDFAALKEISERIGIAPSMEEGKRIETYKSKSENHYEFGSLFEGYLTFEKGEHSRVKTAAHEQDQQEIFRTIQDARERADYVFVSLHTHEGENENWYSDYPAEFIETFARGAVDAGASCVFGHGSHFTRGVELYKGQPIFYNLGSLFMEFEAGESIVSPEMFTAYGYAENEAPSTLHKNRTKDNEGNWQGFYSDRKFSENFLVMFDLSVEENRFDYHLIPIDLRLTHPTVTKRGLPVLASEEAAASLVKRLNAVSQERYQTEITYEGERLTVKKR